MFAPSPESPGTAPIRINLFSDTQTRPSAAMKAAMMAAEVGDEQSGDDPTINALCERMAALLGKQAAMFLPTGTMCNQIAVLTHCRPGDEMLAHERSHILTTEGGGTAALAGVSILPLAGEGGMFGAETLEAAVRPRHRYAPPQTLVATEQTTNLGGGTVWPVALLDAVADAAHRAGLATHMDGARLLNAQVALGVPAARIAQGYDSVWLDFTKGLGAPLGAVLAGSSEFIDAAWRWKQRMGGAFRQGGICAAACLYALDHNVARLADDHANAARLARGLSALPGLEVLMPETNLVFADTASSGREAEVWVRAARERGLRIGAMGKYRLRFCTHLDVSAAEIEAALAIMAEIARF
jgi:threonine aldolase